MISVSLLSGHLYCPRKIFLENVLKIVVPKKEAMVFGTIKHEIFERINSAEQGIILGIGPKTDIFSTYQNEYSMVLRTIVKKNRMQLERLEIGLADAFKAMWPFIETEVRQRGSIIQNYISIHHIYGQELWDKVIPKIESEFAVKSETLNLSGRIDQLRKFPDYLVPVELKTGKAPDTGVWEGHALQMAAYIMLLEEKLQKPLSKGIISYIDYGTERELVVNPFIRDEVKIATALVHELLSGIEVPAFPKNKNKCAQCEHRDKCYNKEFITTQIERLNRKV